MGEMKRAIAREEQDRRTQDRFASTIVIAASIIAAVFTVPHGDGNNRLRFAPTAVTALVESRSAVELLNSQ
jgi:hypothetical protein